MRKVKLVVSDFHLGTGRYRADGTRNYLEDFFFDEKFVEFLEFHRTGEFHDAEVELVINGDFFNLLQLNEVARQEDLFTEEVCRELLRRVLDGHRKLFDALERFASVPRRSIAFVMGNHDPGLLFDSVQALLRERLGERVSFHLDHLRFDAVHIEHGHRWDVLNDFDASRLFLTRGLPEPVVNLPWGAHYLIHVMAVEKAQRPYIDKVTPFRRFLRWAVWNDTRWLLRLVRRSFAFLLHSIFTPKAHRRFRFLELAGKILRYSASPSLEREAAQLLEAQQCEIVVFGHTHHALFREYPGGRTYLNTGTWNHVTSLEIEHLGRQVKLTYALLEWSERHERWDPHLREWKGYHREVEELHR
ncbi:MAG: metallophosphoesterase [Deltaproteobacteria bacterium]|nr:metallophosphoesterase [Deltaproteobacteria bacterium]